MASTFYVNGVTVIDAAPMNDYDSSCYDNFGDGTNYTGVLAMLRTASVYQYTAWDPSDVAGTATNASSTAAATSTAVNYVTVANSSGTLTFTCVKAGAYRFDVTEINETAAAFTNLILQLIIGGTATVLVGTGIASVLMQVASAVTMYHSASFSFRAIMTVGQTVTILPKLLVVSAGVTTNFTQQCTVACEYTGT